jgi:transmembrane sensor
MNRSQQISGPSADEQAALWAARIEGSSLNAADRAALDSWLDEDPGRRALLERYVHFSADLDCLLPELVASGRVKMPAGSAPARNWWSSRWAVAGALAAAALAAAVVWLGRPGDHLENVATSVAQRRSFTLADGTRVELNANTRMLIENNRAERRVRLADGEAFFVVTKDRARPFIVETPAGSVRVTGTIFDVRTEDASELDVTVVEGSVQVHPGEAGGAQPPGPVVLGASDRLSAVAGGVSVQALSASALDDALAWRHGKIVFDGVPLAEALARVAHYHGRRITASDGAAALRISARMSLDDLDGFFTDLEQAMPKVHVTRDPGGDARVSLRSEH